ncbi:unnamed protein product [Moneuplotes crassus]|uniref:Uncharacterized protein n=1 Tax=Euplotes crassus TaxID=5936 RepID=A0AAD2D8C6_EUPCR|nr:unnamed protein product [Moneuplotes crassus]
MNLKKRHLKSWCKDSEKSSSSNFCMFATSCEEPYDAQEKMTQVNEIVKNSAEFFSKNSKVSLVKDKFNLSSQNLENSKKELYSCKKELRLNTGKILTEGAEISINVPCEINREISNSQTLIPLRPAKVVIVAMKQTKRISTEHQVECLNSISRNPNSGNKNDNFSEKGQKLIQKNLTRNEDRGYQNTFISTGISEDQVLIPNGLTLYSILTHHFQMNYCFCSN